MRSGTHPTAKPYGACLHAPLIGNAVVAGRDARPAHPAEEMRLLLRKTAMFFNGYEVPQIESYDIARKQYWTLRMLFVNSWIVMALALTGMVFLVKDWRKLFFLYG